MFLQSYLKSFVRTVSKTILLTKLTARDRDMRGETDCDYLLTSATPHQLRMTRDTESPLYLIEQIIFCPSIVTNCSNSARVGKVSICYVGYFTNNNLACISSSRNKRLLSW